jgi:hypothetical protein
MKPLAAVVGGEIDLEDALVNGRFNGHIAEGRMATSIIGAGRVFHTSLIDGSGGSKWSYYVLPSKTAGEAPALTFESEAKDLETRLREPLHVLVEPFLQRAGWTRIEYDPGPGFVRMTRPMRTRHDIPSVEEFRTQLNVISSAADLNRSVQHPEP